MLISGGIPWIPPACPEERSIPWLHSSNCKISLSPRSLRRSGFLGRTGKCYSRPHCSTPGITSHCGLASTPFRPTCRSLRQAVATRFAAYSALIDSLIPGSALLDPIAAAKHRLDAWGGSPAWNVDYAGLVKQLAAALASRFRSAATPEYRILGPGAAAIPSRDRVRNSPPATCPVSSNSSTCFGCRQRRPTGTFLQRCHLRTRRRAATRGIRDRRSIGNRRLARRATCSALLQVCLSYRV